MPLYLCARLSFQGQSDLNISYSMPPLIDPMMLHTLVSKTDKDLTIGIALLYSIKKAFNVLLLPITYNSLLLIIAEMCSAWPQSPFLALFSSHIFSLFTVTS